MADAVCKGRDSAGDPCGNPAVFRSEHVTCYGTDPQWSTECAEEGGACECGPVDICSEHAPNLGTHHDVCERCISLITGGYILFCTECSLQICYKCTAITGCQTTEALCLSCFNAEVHFNRDYLYGTDCKKCGGPVSSEHAIGYSEHMLALSDDDGWLVCADCDLGG